MSNCTGVVADMPEADAVDLAVGEPEAGVVGVVAGFTGSAFLEWVVPGHAGCAGADHGVQYWL